VKDIKAKRPSLLSQLDASFGSSPSNSTVQISNVSGSSVVKPEPSDGVIPRKRPFDAGLSGGTVKTEVGAADPPLTPPSLKKFKAEAPKTPLALVNTNTANQVQASAPGLSLAEATAQVNEINRKLTMTEADFKKLARKPRRTKAEMTKFGRYSREIDRLQARKNDYAAIISSLALIPQQIVKPEPFSMALVPSSVVSHLPAQLLPASHKPTSPLVAEQKPLIHRPQPIASGSNVRLPDAHLAYRDVKIDSDDDGDDNNELSSDGLGLPYNFELPYDPPAAMGPAAAVIGGYGENFDADGNFHGRGRDRFAGPQADADEYAVS
jgi:cell pole-organizing protein PopZ